MSLVCATGRPGQASAHRCTRYSVENHLRHWPARLITGGAEWRAQPIASAQTNSQTQPAVPARDRCNNR